MEKIKVTALEKMTMDYIVNLMYDEKGFSDIKELYRIMSIDPKILKEILSNLCKKDLIVIDEILNIIYLSGKTEGLVNSWLLDGSSYPVTLIT